jgi:hypothetical protein
MQQSDLFHQRWSMFHAAVWRQADWFRRYDVLKSLPPDLTYEQREEIMEVIDELQEFGLLESRRHYSGSKHPGIKGYRGFWDEYRIKRGTPAIDPGDTRRRADNQHGTPPDIAR